MSDQPYALRMADLNANCALAWKEGSEPHQFRMDTAAELRRQHSRIEADEALMRQAEKALDLLTDESMVAMTDETMETDKSVSAWNGACLAITALGKRLESSNADQA